mgnify:CR=1 FL=1
MVKVPDRDVVREIVIEAARDAGVGQSLLRDASIKDDGSVVTTADHLLQDKISAALHERWPHIPFMGEEMEHARQDRIVNTKGGTFWTLDPLDGTTNFSMGFPFYGVSLALVSAGEVALGVVYDLSLIHI